MNSPNALRIAEVLIEHGRADLVGLPRRLRRIKARITMTGPIPSVGRAHRPRLTPEGLAAYKATLAGAR